MGRTMYFDILNNLQQELKNDELYESETDRAEAFVYLGLREIHDAVKNNISLEESKDIVYKNDIIDIIKKWENQCECGINESCDTMTYYNLALVPIIDELIEIFQEKYGVSCITQDVTGKYKFSHQDSSPLFSWSRIYMTTFC